MLPAVALGRFGCLFYGCCAGRETASWLGVMLPDHHGTLRRRFPSQLLESVLGATLFALALTLHLSPPGLLFTIVIGLYALGRLGLWITREPVDTSGSTRLKFGLWGVFLLGAVLTALITA
jgi:phosphatidylglycerol:prolipoprotein diacylglycerol transferase